METKRDISDFFNTDYTEWAKGVIEDRAIPSVIDGLKPAARKVIHAALTGTTKSGKLYKLLALSGDAMRVSLYAHGDASLNSVITGLCKPYSDTLHPLESDSQVGSLHDPDACGSPRYLYVRHSQFMDLYKTDMELLKYVTEEGQQVEPEHYLPVIPVILCRQNLGLAVGYSMRNMSYNPVDIIDACLFFLKKISRKPKIRPYITGADNSAWTQSKAGRWTYNAKYTVDIKKKTVTVCDLPYNMTYTDFESMLDKYIESGEVKDWKNMSSGSDIKYIITLTAKFGWKQSDIQDKLKLSQTVQPDLLWVLDETGKLIYFENIYDLIKYFVSYRIKIYKKRKSLIIKNISDKLAVNTHLADFIKYVCDGTIKITVKRNRPVKDIEADMKKYNLPNTLLNTPLSKCTKEEYNRLLKDNQELKKNLDNIKNTDITDLYINDLNTLKKNFKKIFK